MDYSSELRRASAFVGLAFRTRREQLNLTQEQVAEQADVHRNYYGRLERGEENPTLEVLIRVCRFLDISLANVFEETAPESRSRF